MSEKKSEEPRPLRVLSKESLTSIGKVLDDTLKWAPKLGPEDDIYNQKMISKAVNVLSSIYRNYLKRNIDWGMNAMDLVEEGVNLLIENAKAQGIFSIDASQLRSTALGIMYVEICDEDFKEDDVLGEKEIGEIQEAISEKFVNKTNYRKLVESLVEVQKGGIKEAMSLFKKGCWGDKEVDLSNVKGMKVAMATIGEQEENFFWLLKQKEDTLDALGLEVGNSQYSIFAIKGNLERNAAISNRLKEALDLIGEIPTPDKLNQSSLLGGMDNWKGRDGGTQYGEEGGRNR